MMEVPSAGQTSELTAHVYPHCPPVKCCSLTCTEGSFKSLFERIAYVHTPLDNAFEDLGYPLSVLPSYAGSYEGFASLHPNSNFNFSAPFASTFLCM